MLMMMMTNLPKCGWPETSLKLKEKLNPGQRHLLPRPGHEDDFGCCNSARMLCEAAPTQRAEVGRCRGASAGSPAIPQASRMKD